MLKSNGKLKVILLTLLTSVILLSTSTIAPAVYSRDTTILTEKSKFSFDDDIKDVIDFIEYVCENNTENIYEMLIQYNHSKEGNKLTDKIDINLILSIFNYIIKETNEDDQTPMEFYHLFKNKEIKFFELFSNFDYEEYSGKNILIKEVIDPINPYFNLQSDGSSNNNNFEKYWINYSKAKAIWAGNIPRKTNIPSKNQFMPFKVWSGVTFHEWYLNGCNFLFGLNDKQGESTFYIVNKVGWYAVTALFIFCLFSFIWGVFGNSVEMAFMSAAMTGSLGLLVSVLLLYLDFNIMLYLMFGVNDFLNMFEWGNVDLVVQLKGDQETLNSCTVEAYNENAYSKDGSNLYEDLDVPWSLDEFTYELVLANGNENNDVYTICYPEYIPKDDDGTIHSQWEKAVPPPGDWTVRVLDQNENVIATQTITDAEPRTSYFITIEI